MCTTKVPHGSVRHDPSHPFSDTSSSILLKPKGSIGHVFTLCRRNKIKIKPAAPLFFHIRFLFSLSYLKTPALCTGKACPKKGGRRHQGVSPTYIIQTLYKMTSGALTTFSTKCYFNIRLRSLQNALRNNSLQHVSSTSLQNASKRIPHLDKMTDIKRILYKMMLIESPTSTT